MPRKTDEILERNDQLTVVEQFVDTVLEFIHDGEYDVAVPFKLFALFSFWGLYCAKYVCIGVIFEVRSQDFSYTMEVEGAQRDQMCKKGLGVCIYVLKSA